jgi:hypothetical protein
MYRFGRLVHFSGARIYAEPYADGIPPDSLRKYMKWNNFTCLNFPECVEWKRIVHSFRHPHSVQSRLHPTECHLVSPVRVQFFIFCMNKSGLWILILFVVYSAGVLNGCGTAKSGTKSASGRPDPKAVVDPTEESSTISSDPSTSYTTASSDSSDTTSSGGSDDDDGSNDGISDDVPTPVGGRPTGPVVPPYLPPSAGADGDPSETFFLSSGSTSDEGSSSDSDSPSDENSGDEGEEEKEEKRKNMVKNRKRGTRRRKRIVKEEEKEDEHRKKRRWVGQSGTNSDDESKGADEDESDTFSLSSGSTTDGDSSSDSPSDHDEGAKITTKANKGKRGSKKSRRLPTFPGLRSPLLSEKEMQRLRLQLLPYGGEGLEEQEAAAAAAEDQVGVLWNDRDLQWLKLNMGPVLAIIDHVLNFHPSEEVPENIRKWSIRRTGDMNGCKLFNSPRGTWLLVCVDGGSVLVLNKNSSNTNVNAFFRNNRNWSTILATKNLDFIGKCIAYRAGHGDGFVIGLVERLQHALQERPPRPNARARQDVVEFLTDNMDLINATMDSILGVPPPRVVNSPRAKRRRGGCSLFYSAKRGFFEVCPDSVLRFADGGRDVRIIDSIDRSDSDWMTVLATGNLDFIGACLAYHFDHPDDDEEFLRVMFQKLMEPPRRGNSWLNENMETVLAHIDTVLGGEVHEYRDAVENSRCGQFRVTGDEDVQVCVIGDGFVSMQLEGRNRNMNLYFLNDPNWSAVFATRKLELIGKCLAHWKAVGGQFMETLVRDLQAEDRNDELSTDDTVDHPSDHYISSDEESSEELVGVSIEEPAGVDDREVNWLVQNMGQIIHIFDRDYGVVQIKTGPVGCGDFQVLGRRAVNVCVKDGRPITVTSDDGSGHTIVWTERNDPNWRIIFATMNRRFIGKCVALALSEEGFIEGLLRRLHRELDGVKNSRYENIGGQFNQRIKDVKDRLRGLDPPPKLSIQLPDVANWAVREPECSVFESKRRGYFKVCKGPPPSVRFYPHRRGSNLENWFRRDPDWMSLIGTNDVELIGRLLVKYFDDKLNFGGLLDDLFVFAVKGPHISPARPDVLDWLIRNMARAKVELSRLMARPNRSQLGEGLNWVIGRDCAQFFTQMRGYLRICPSSMDVKFQRIDVPPFSTDTLRSDPSWATVFATGDLEFIGMCLAYHFDHPGDAGFLGRFFDEWQCGPLPDETVVQWLRNNMDRILSSLDESLGGDVSRSYTRARREGERGEFRFEDGKLLSVYIPADGSSAPFDLIDGEMNSSPMIDYAPGDVHWVSILATRNLELITKCLVLLKKGTSVGKLMTQFRRAAVAAPVRPPQDLIDANDVLELFPAFLDDEQPRGGHALDSDDFFPAGASAGSIRQRQRAKHNWSRFVEGMLSKVKESSDDPLGQSPSEDLPKHDSSVDDPLHLFFPPGDSIVPESPELDVVRVELGLPPIPERLVVVQGLMDAVLARLPQVDDISLTDLLERNRQQIAAIAKRLPQSSPGSSSALVQGVGTDLLSLLGGLIAQPPQVTPGAPIYRSVFDPQTMSLRAVLKLRPGNPVTLVNFKGSQDVLAAMGRDHVLNKLMLQRISPDILRDLWQLAYESKEVDSRPIIDDLFPGVVGESQRPGVMEDGQPPMSLNSGSFFPAEVSTDESEALRKSLIAQLNQGEDKSDMDDLHAGVESDGRVHARDGSTRGSEGPPGGSQLIRKSPDFVIADNHVEFLNPRLRLLAEIFGWMNFPAALRRIPASALANMLNQALARMDSPPVIPKRLLLADVANRAEAAVEKVTKLAVYFIDDVSLVDDARRGVEQRQIPQQLTPVVGPVPISFRVVEGLIDRVIGGLIRRGVTIPAIVAGFEEHAKEIQRLVKSTRAAIVGDTEVDSLVSGVSSQLTSVLGVGNFFIPNESPMSPIVSVVDTRTSLPLALLRVPQSGPVEILFFSGDQAFLENIANDPRWLWFLQRYGDKPAMVKEMFGLMYDVRGIEGHGLRVSDMLPAGASRLILEQQPIDDFYPGLFAREIQPGHGVIRPDTPRPGVIDADRLPREPPTSLNSNSFFPAEVSTDESEALRVQLNQGEDKSDVEELYPGLLHERHGPVHGREGGVLVPLSFSSVSSMLSTNDRLFMRELDPLNRLLRLRKVNPDDTLDRLSKLARTDGLRDPSRFPQLVGEDDCRFFFISKIGKFFGICIARDGQITMVGLGDDRSIALIDSFRDNEAWLNVVATKDPMVIGFVIVVYFDKFYSGQKHIDNEEFVDMSNVLVTANDQVSEDSIAGFRARIGLPAVAPAVRAAEIWMGQFATGLLGRMKIRDIAGLMSQPQISRVLHELVPVIDASLKTFAPGNLAPLRVSLWNRIRGSTGPDIRPPAGPVNILPIIDPSDSSVVAVLAPGNPVNIIAAPGLSAESLDRIRASPIWRKLKTPQLSVKAEAFRLLLDHSERRSVKDIADLFPGIDQTTSGQPLGPDDLLLGGSQLIRKSPDFVIADNHVEFLNPRLRLLAEIFGWMNVPAALRGIPTSALANMLNQALARMDSPPVIPKRLLLADVANRAEAAVKKVTKLAVYFIDDVSLVDDARRGVEQRQIPQQLTPVVGPVPISFRVVEGLIDRVLGGLISRGVTFPEIVAGFENHANGIKRLVESTRAAVLGDQEVDSLESDVSNQLTSLLGVGNYFIPNEVSRSPIVSIVDTRTSMPLALLRLPQDGLPEVLYFSGDQAFLRMIANDPRWVQFLQRYGNRPAKVKEMFRLMYDMRGIAGHRLVVNDSPPAGAARSILEQQPIEDLYPGVFKPVSVGEFQRTPGGGDTQPDTPRPSMIEDDVLPLESPVSVNSNDFFPADVSIDEALRKSLIAQLHEAEPRDQPAPEIDYHGRFNHVLRDLIDRQSVATVADRVAVLEPLLPSVRCDLARGRFGLPKIPFRLQAIEEMLGGLLTRLMHAGRISDADLLSLLEKKRKTLQALVRHLMHELVTPGTADGHQLIAAFNSNVASLLDGIDDGVTSTPHNGGEYRLVFSPSTMELLAVLKFENLAPINVLYFNGPDALLQRIAHNPVWRRSGGDSPDELAGLWRLQYDAIEAGETIDPGEVLNTEDETVVEDVYPGVTERAVEPVATGGVTVGQFFPAGDAIAPIDHTLREELLNELVEGSAEDDDCRDFEAAGNMFTVCIPVSGPVKFIGLDDVSDLLASLGRNRIWTALVKSRNIDSIAQALVFILSRGYVLNDSERLMDAPRPVVGPNRPPRRVSLTDLTGSIPPVVVPLVRELFSVEDMYFVEMLARLNNRMRGERRVSERDISGMLAITQNEVPDTIVPRDSVVGFFGTKPKKAFALIVPPVGDIKIIGLESETRVLARLAGTTAWQRIIQSRNVDLIGWGLVYLLDHPERVDRVAALVDGASGTDEDVISLFPGVTAKVLESRSSKFFPAGDVIARFKAHPLSSTLISLRETDLSTILPPVRENDLIQFELAIARFISRLSVDEHDIPGLIARAQSNLAALFARGVTDPKKLDRLLTELGLGDAVVVSDRQPAPSVVCDDDGRILMLSSIASTGDSNVLYMDDEVSGLLNRMPQAMIGRLNQNMRRPEFGQLVRLGLGLTRSGLGILTNGILGRILGGGTRKPLACTGDRERVTCSVGTTPVVEISRTSPRIRVGRRLRNVFKNNVPRNVWSDHRIPMGILLELVNALVPKAYPKMILDDPEGPAEEMVVGQGDLVELFPEAGIRTLNSRDFFPAVPLALQEDPAIVEADEEQQTISPSSVVEGGDQDDAPAVDEVTLFPAANNADEDVALKAFQRRPDSSN